MWHLYLFNASNLFGWSGGSEKSPLVWNCCARCIILRFGSGALQWSIRCSLLRLQFTAFWIKTKERFVWKVRKYSSLELTDVWVWYYSLQRLSLFWVLLHRVLTEFFAKDVLYLLNSTNEITLEEANCNLFIHSYN